MKLQNKIKWLTFQAFGENFEISTEVLYKNKTYSAIKKLLKKDEEIASYPLIQMLRNEKAHKCFEDFSVFVPNPDKISEENDYVAWFGAGSDWAVLDCDWDPTSRDASLGVFVIRRKR